MFVRKVGLCALSVPLVIFSCGVDQNFIYSEQTGKFTPFPLCFRFSKKLLFLKPLFRHRTNEPKHRAIIVFLDFIFKRKQSIFCNWRQIFWKNISIFSFLRFFLLFWFTKQIFSLLKTSIFQIFIQWAKFCEGNMS